MDTKIPKPSGLKKPTSFFDFNKFSTKTDVKDSKKTEINNTTLSQFRFNRAHSPEFKVSTEAHLKSKLRRSKSASDITVVSKMAAQKRFQPTLEPIATKKIKPNPATNIKPTITRKFGDKENTAKSTTSLNRNPSVKSTVSTASAKIIKPVTVTSKPAAASKNIATKHIPKYDYKARFANLEEKYKVLKEKYDNIVEDQQKYEHMVEENDEMKKDIMILKNENAELKSEGEERKKEIATLTIKNNALSSALNSTKNELEALKEQHEKTTSEYTDLQKQHSDLVEKSGTLEKDFESAKALLDASQEQLYAINIERKNLHNMVMDLRGNIRVFCRVRPPLAIESEKFLCDWNFMDEASLEIHLNDKKQAFGFDHVFNPNSLQEDIFEMVSPLIQSALDGYNVCIFAYGQTGSGKTFTMDGADGYPGIIPRTIQLLFDAIKHTQVRGWTYEIRASFLEIYNEVLYDLLNPEATDIEIRMANPRSKTEIYVSNITEEAVPTAQRLQQLMNIARSNRATAATAGNERSSRSHAVTRIQLIGTHESSKEVLVGNINLVDLAGSESPKTSIRMDETKNINRSLSELSNVILALVQRNDHVPYRNSKLTHLLMPSLGGNSKTLMFVNVSPFQDCYVESVKSLRFAAQVNSCKMAKAKRNKQFNSSSAF